MEDRGVASPTVDYDGTWKTDLGIPVPPITLSYLNLPDTDWSAWSATDLRPWHARFGDALRAHARFALHNAIAHPLLVLCPPLGRWLHDRTAPA